LAKICGEHVRGIRRDPLRQVDGFVDAGIEPDQDAGRPAVDILDRVTIALRDAADRDAADVALFAIARSGNGRESRTS
jgi:hypothetical protein